MSDLRQQVEKEETCPGRFATIRQSLMSSDDDVLTGASDNTNGKANGTSTPSGGTTTAGGTSSSRPVVVTNTKQKKG